MSVVFEGVDMPAACCFVAGEHSVFARMEYCKFYNICKQRDTIKNNYKPDDCPVKLLKQEPTTQERQAESDRFDAVFQDGYDHGYAQARFDYEQEPTTKNDVVPRKVVERIIKSPRTQEQMLSMLNSIQSVTPQEPRKGHWIADVDRWGDVVTTVNGYKCDKCNAFNSDKDNYCPNCGADMREVEK